MTDTKSQNSSTAEKTSEKTAEKSNGKSQEHAHAQAVFSVVGQYAKDISVECNKPPFTASESTQVNLNMDVGVATNSLGDDNYEVALKLRGDAKDDKGESCYLVEVEYRGVFLLKNIPQEQISAVLSIDGAAMLFPFARQLFMDAVIATSYRPGILEPINFHQLFMQARAEQLQQAKQQDSAGEQKQASL